MSDLFEIANFNSISKKIVIFLKKCQTFVELECELECELNSPNFKFPKTLQISKTTNKIQEKLVAQMKLTIQKLESLPYLSNSI